MKNFINTALVIFLVAGAIHTVRLFSGWPLVVGPWEVPLWLSGVIVAILLYMIWWGRKLTR